jgi:glycosyltransferase involved in cell wall biosynthesis
MASAGVVERVVAPRSEGGHTMRLRLIVDGIVLRDHPHAGINRVFNAVLPRLAERADTTVELLVPDPCVGALPGGRVRLRARSPFGRTNLSWKLDQALETLNRALVGARVKILPGAVFQSTYFTMLPPGWPQVAIAHDFNHELFPEAYETDWGRWLRGVYPRYLRRARRIVAVSETTKQHAIRFYGIDAEKIDVVRWGVESETFFVDREPETLASLKERFGVRPPYLLYVGGRSAYKNFQRVLDAFARVADRYDLTLVVAGEGWSRAERLIIDAFEARQRLVLIEYPDDDLLRSLYNFATAFVFPSLWEGFGLPLLEAMACGSPIIASATEVFQEVAGDVPIYFDPYDTDDLARAIEVAAKGSAPPDLVSRGLDRVRSFSWDRSAEELHRVYVRA